MFRRSHGLRSAPSLASRCIILGLAAITLTCQLLAPWHYVLVTHVVCAESGELLHLDELHKLDEVAAPSVHMGQQRAEGLIVGTARTVLSPQHDRCLLATYQRERSILCNTCGPRREAPPNDAHARWTRSEPRLAAEALYRLAPKNSPPARWPEQRTSQATL